jgi:hypothetical protein
LKKSYTETITPGDSTILAIRSGYSYDILSKSGGDPASYGMITMNDNTGVISTTSSIIPGTYTLTLRNTGSYNITIFVLTISGSTPVPCLTEESKVLTENGYVSISDLKVKDTVISVDFGLSMMTTIITLSVQFLMFSKSFVKILTISKVE